MILFDDISPDIYLFLFIMYVAVLLCYAHTAQRFAYLIYWAQSILTLAKYSYQSPHL